MDRYHSMILFADMYPVDEISKIIIDRFAMDQINSSNMDSILLHFLSSTKESSDIVSALLRGEPLVFMLSYLILYPATREYRHVNRNLQDRCRSIMLDYAKECIFDMSDEDLCILLAKDKTEGNVFIERIGEDFYFPLDHCKNDMVGFIKGYNHFRAIVSRNYFLFLLSSWITDSILELNRTSLSFYRSNLSLISRGEEFLNTIGESEKKCRREAYEKMPYADRLLLKRFDVIYNALKSADMLNTAITTQKIRHALERYEPEYSGEKKHIEFLLNEAASISTARKMERKHADEKSHIHEILSSSLVRSRVRIVKKRWLKYIIYPSGYKIQLETFDDIDRMMVFPCIQKVMETGEAPHNVLAAMFSVLLWFYRKGDCHYILKNIIGLETYNFDTTEEQLKSLIDDNEFPKYLYGTEGFVPNCVDYINCPRCLLFALDFPDEYFLRKEERKLSIKTERK